MAYAFTKGIIINPARIGAADLTNYPMGFIGTYIGAGLDPDLRQTSSGGDVTSLTGYDIVFSTDFDNAIPLDFEIERYIPTTGEVVFWIRVPTVSHTANTVIFMHYGDAAVVTFQGDVNGTWASQFKAVWHLGSAAQTVPSNPVTDYPIVLTDSTVSARTAVDDCNAPIVAFAKPGIADGCLQADDGTRLSFSDTGLPSGTSSFTYSIWFLTPAPAFFSNGRLFTVGSYINANQYVGLIANTTTLTADGYGFGAGSGLIYTPAGLIQDTWYHVAITFNGTTATMYLNGAAVATGAVGWSVVLGGTGYIGGQNPGIANQTSDCQIDETRLANQVMAPSWVLAEYNNISSPSTFYSFGGEPFTATCGDPPDGVAGEFYTHTFPTPASGGVPPFHWALLTRDDLSFVPEDVLNNITLDGGTAVWSGYPAAPGIYEFTLDVFDTVSTESKVDCTITIAEGTAGDENPDWVPVPPVGVPDGTHGWDFNAACAHEGSLGLRHRADGTEEVANSKTTSLDPITVVAAQILYAAFWLKGSGSANGTVGFGFVFYDEDDVYLSESYVTSTGSPTSWTQFNGSITVPANAVKAVPTVETIAHLTGTWCIDDVYAIFSGGHFTLSSIKHYFDDYTAYR